MHLSATIFHVFLHSNQPFPRDSVVPAVILFESQSCCSAPRQWFLFTFDSCCCREKTRIRINFFHEYLADKLADWAQTMGQNLNYDEIALV